MALIDEWTPEALPAPRRLEAVPDPALLDPEKFGDERCPRMSFSGPGALAEMQAFLDTEDLSPPPVSGKIARPPLSPFLRNLQATYDALLEIETVTYAPEQRPAALAIEQAVAAERQMFEAVAGRLAVGR